ncbi:MAG: T9SS type A sorting domain-containing protein [Flavobacterium sp.]|uniref:T9SS type A sorting domain-containing protein n=1 Tax=Flavobacterium sp. TaxID=239 RepID=UPI003266634C
MKYLLLFVSILCGVNCFSQDPNPQLFQTWYLRFVQTNDFAPAYTISAVDPPIAPTLTISADLSFSGNGACNTFTGSFATMDASDYMPGTFSATLAICGPQIHNSVEGSYFYFLQSPGYYNIYTEGTGRVLIFGTPLFGQAIFQNFPLKNKDFSLEQIAIYPNPTSSTVFINSNQIPISKVQVINSLGQNVKTINQGFEAIDISELSSGIYVLEITTDLGTINKKIIKN